MSAEKAAQANRICAAERAGKRIAAKKAAAAVKAGIYAEQVAMEKHGEATRTQYIWEKLQIIERLCQCTQQQLR